MAQRSGGRQARHALRSAPLAADIKPVNPGELGGQYKPLSESDIAAIDENIFRILEEIGFNDATPHCIETCTSVGAILGDDGRLRMPRQVVENALKLAERNLILYGQEPAYDRQISGTRVHFATGGAAVMIADSVNNCYRESTAQDLYDLARIVDTCEHFHIFQRMCVLRDIADNYEMERPFVSQSNCFVVPPMKFATDALECLRVAVEGGMPVLLLSAGQAGATTPACLAGATSQAWAECLGGLVYVNAIKPGAPAILGAWPFISDLRTGSMSGGSPEQGLLSAACAQMGVQWVFTSTCRLAPPAA